MYLQITKGHGITGMRDNVVWGLFIVNFIFFIGLSYAGAVICAILHLFKIKWRHPIFRLTDRSDAELLIQFKNPDTREAAYTSIIRKYQEKLYWHIRRMGGG